VSSAKFGDGESRYRISDDFAAGDFGSSHLRTLNENSPTRIWRRKIFPAG
jgi:hypothetical protein